MHFYRHFSFLEREEISRGLAQGWSLRAIASSLQRSPSSVSREVKRHWTCVGYRACRAAFRARKRSRKSRRVRFLFSQPVLWKEIQGKLRLRWSPEQISAWLRKTYAAKDMQASHETIYAALYVLTRGTLRKELLSCLRRRHRRRRKRGSLLKDRRGQLPDIVSIHERPSEVEDREVAGHWEGDILMGKAAAVGTLVERTTRYVMLCHLSAPTAEKAWRAFARRFNTLPESLRQSLTYDRGKEMAEHKKLSAAAKVKVYFCDPQSPWQRGTNENTNGLLRQFLPKGTDFSQLTNRQLRHIEELLNGRPRKTLDWLTPNEAFTSCLAVALQS